tara:strand:+ start:80 stop:334 length:255 start_codon:yes stop_codon:yes gene_type:complete
MKKLIIVLIMIVGIFTSCENLDEIDQCGIVTNYDFEYSNFVDQFGNPLNTFYYVWLDENKHQVNFSTFDNVRRLGLGVYECIYY